jgi:hypothetical protein
MGRRRRRAIGGRDTSGHLKCHLRRYWDQNALGALYARENEAGARRLTFRASHGAGASHPRHMALRSSLSTACGPDPARLAKSRLSMVPTTRKARQSSGIGKGL